MGFFGRLFGKPKGRELVLRERYQELPKEQWTDDEHDHWMATCSEEEYWADWEEWSRRTYDHPTIHRVRRSVLDLALAASKDSFPQEFAALLRVKGDTVTELVLLTGTIQGDEHCILPLGNAPVDTSVKGSLHSHPDPHPYPSDADFELFEHHGTIHLILCEPYGPDDWRAYDHTGLPIHLDVVRDRENFDNLPGARGRPDRDR